MGRTSIVFRSKAIEGLRLRKAYVRIIANFQVARNPLKFGMPPTLFVLKNVPVFFCLFGLSTSGQRRLQIRSEKHTRTVFWLSRIEMLRCLDTDRERGEERRGGGRLNFAQYYAYFSVFLKKKHRDTKRIDMPNFSGFRAT